MLKTVLLFLALAIFGLQGILIASGQTGMRHDSGKEAYPRPLFSCLVDKEKFVADFHLKDDSICNLGLSIVAHKQVDSVSADLTRTKITFVNNSKDTVIFENVVPYGESPDRVYLTSSGHWDLVRAKIFIPGKAPVGVILPDNAWELGFTADQDQCALARRTKWNKALRKRYETWILPGGSVTYTLWERSFTGTWQNALRQFCQRDYLFDLTHFDESLFHRPDLSWIRKSYLIYLQFAWDRDFYDAGKGSYQLIHLLKEAQPRLGHYDVYGIWPTWPRLGMD